MGVRGQSPRREAEQVTSRERRVSHPPLRFDWSRMGGPLYRARPDSTFTLFAFRSGGGSWRWSISMATDDGGFAPLHVGDNLSTLIRAKLAAESWYREHGGTPTHGQTEVWTEVKPDADPPPF